MRADYEKFTDELRAEARRVAVAVEVARRRNIQELRAVPFIAYYMLLRIVNAVAMWSPGGSKFAVIQIANRLISSSLKLFLLTYV